MSALAVAGASLALAACGSSGSSGSASSTTTQASGQSGAQAGGQAGGQNGTQNADFQKFQQCLKDNGVTLPNRGGGGQGGPPAGGGNGQPPTGTNGAPPAGGFAGRSQDPKTQKAMQACAKYRPQGAGRGGYGAGGGGGGNGGGAGGNIQAFTPYLTCLKDQGLDVKVSDGFQALRNLKQSDPKVQAALKSCQAKLPQRPNRGGGSTTAPGSTSSSSGTT
ncbi:MAG TPA: hypothetical protein VI318_04155 [Baekduia sp.]